MINIKSDSRRIKKGDIFVALDGINSNGSCYIQNAIASGASKIVCKQGSFDVETINVTDPKKYLTNYLIDNYGKYLDEMKIIGITGTNGKTTVAYLIYQMLNSLGLKCAYIGTIGFYLDKKVYSLPNTSPDTCMLYEMIMEAYDNGFKHIVIEVSSQGLAYNRFDGINFDYAIFTNLTLDHLDFHKTMENYALAKKKLFQKLKESGIGLVNADDKYKKYFTCKNLVTYGLDSGDYRVIDYKLSMNDTMIDIEYKDNRYKYLYPLIGKYNIYNMVATIALLNQMGIDFSKINTRNIKSPDGRMDILKYKGNTIIIDYAHTPDAMDNIYKTIKPLVKGKIITVFGCTGSREREKRPLMMQLALNNSDYVYVTSDDLHEESFSDIVSDMLKNVVSNKYEVIQDRGVAIKKAMDRLSSSDMLLILGKGHEQFIIVGNKQIPFNDHKKVMEIIENMKSSDKV